MLSDLPKMRPLHFVPTCNPLDQVIEYASLGPRGTARMHSDEPHLDDEYNELS